MSIVIKNKIKDVSLHEVLIAILISLMAINLLLPYYIWSAFGKIFFEVPLIVFFLFAIVRFRLDLNKMCLGMLIVILLLYFNLQSVSQGNEKYFILYLFYSTFFVFSISIKYPSKSYIWSIFICIFAMLCLPAIIIYFLRFYVDLPYKIIPAMNTLKSYNYLAFPGAVFPNVQSFAAYRLHGIFDEPGALGTYSGVIISLDQFRNKVPSLIILVAGLMSFSVAFYVILALFIFLRSKNRVRNALLLLFVFIFVSSFEYTNKYFVARFCFSNGEIVADNRDKQSFIGEFSDFIRDKDELLFGKGRLASEKSGGAGGSSVRMFVYDYGLFGFFLVFFVYILLFLLFPTKNNLVVGFILFLSMYQRPEIYTYGYLLIFCLGSSSDYELGKKMLSKEGV